VKAGRAYAPDRSAPPPAGEVRPFRFPPYVRRELASGLTVFAARQPRAPLVRLALTFPAGAERTSPQRAGLAALTAQLLDEGTARRSSLEIAADAERLGAQLDTGADWDRAWVSLELESRHAADGLELVAEVATTPSFPAEEVARLRRRRLAEILRQRAEPSFLARERFSRTVYGGSAYGLPVIGTEDSLGALDRAAVVDFYRHHYTLAGAHAVAVGDLDPQRLIAEIDERLGPGDGRRPPAGPEIRPAALGGVEVHLVDRPGAAQTQLVIGHAGPPRRHPDFVALQVLNAILGGKFTSRINLNLRERHGYTYGATSRFDGRLGPGPFTVGAAVANPVAGAAAGEVLAEMARIRDQPVPETELDDSRNYLIGVFPYTLQSVAGLSQRLESLAVYGLPADYYDRFPQAVREVDAERVLAVARRHLHPDALAVVAVGPAAELAPQFERLGTVRVWKAEGEAAAAAESA
jgi:zinc protease